MLDPATLSAVMGGLGGLGGGTKVKVNQSTSTAANVSLSISNVTGGELQGNTGAPVNVSPVSSASQSPLGSSPSPAYGAFPDSAYDTSPLYMSEGTTKAGAALNNPALIAVAVGLIALGAVAAFTKRRR